MASLAPAGVESATPTIRRSTTSWHDAASSFWPLAALGVLALLQFTLVFTRAINWDEYSYFREVAWFAEGRLDRPLQTIHVRLFAWLPGLFSSSTDHIVVARVAMFGCELVTLASIYTVARRFGDHATALFAALAYLSAGFVLQHGTSFRVDPILTASLSASLAILATAELRLPAILGFGLLAGFAGMVSVKAVLYLPAFAGLALWRWQNAGWSRVFLARLAACGVAALVAFAMIYLWHAQGVSAASGASGSARAVVDTAGGWAFFLGIPPYWKMLVKAIATAPVLAIMVGFLPVFLHRSPLPFGTKFALMGLWLPVAALAFYINTAAYFYVFLLAPLAMAIAPVMKLALDRYGPRLVALVLLAIGSGIWLTEDRTTIDRQRQLEANVHEVFAEPVAYFDHNYMLGAWPKANNFLTPWGIDAYRKAGQPAYRRAMEIAPVPLLLANHELLQAVMEGERDEPFLPADLAALRNNYVLLSWPIWVAGKDYAGKNGSLADEFLVPGVYTLERGPLTIDGIAHDEGAVVQLARGDHEIAIPAGSEARLVWGDHLRSPRDPIAPGDLYVEF